MFKVGTDPVIALLVFSALVMSACNGSSIATTTATYTAKASANTTSTVATTHAIPSATALVEPAVLASPSALSTAPGATVTVNGTITANIDRLSLSDAVDKTKNATAYRVELSMVGKGIFTFDANTPEPGSVTTYVPLLRLKGDVNGKDDHYLLQGILAAFIGVDAEKGFETITVGGKTYLHGPVSMLGATEDKWYELPADQVQAALPSVDPIDILGSLESAGLTPQDFTKSGAENLDNLRCAVYSGDQTIATRLFQASSGSTDTTITLTNAVLQDWVCSDGYFHQMRLTVEGQIKDKPDQKGTYSVLLHIFDIGANIVIEAPANVELLVTPTPFTIEISPTIVNTEQTPEATLEMPTTAVSTRTITLPSYTQDICAAPSAIGSLKTTLTMKATQEGQTLVAFSPDGALLASVANNSGGTLTVWNASTGDELHETIGDMTVMAFSADGKLLAYAGNSNLITILDVASWEQVKQIETTSDSIWSIAFSPDGKMIATADDAYELKVWDTITGGEFWQLGKGRDRGNSGLSFSPDGTTIVNSGQFLETILWDTATGLALHQADEVSVNSVAFSPDGMLIAGGDTTSQVIFWDAKTMQTLNTVVMGVGQTVYSVAFSPDGTLLVAGGYPGDAGDESTIKIWSVATGDEVVTADETGEIHSVTFSPDCNYLASGDNKGFIKVWALGR